MVRRHTRDSTPRRTRRAGGTRKDAAAAARGSSKAASAPGRRQGRPGANAKSSFERYVALAKAAAQSGDPVAAENYYQHADHYYRLMNEAGT